MKRGKLLSAVVLAAALLLGVNSLVTAQDAPATGFSLQVTPSPLISTVEPGTRTSLELKVQNKNSVSEELKMELRSFSVESNGEVRISEETAANVADFVSFEEEFFTVEAGQWYTQQIHVDTPSEAGFSYSFAILISRKDPSPVVDGVSNIEGSVAVFTLLNVNRPDAVKQLELSSFISAKKSYEYLPAEFELSINNTGNTIVQPRGNIFIGRGDNEQQPMAVLEINPNDGYIIPDSTRVLKTQWGEGFPSRNENGDLVWDWSKISQLRIGRYTAKAILIYDDGQRDIPIESTVTFWVLPWKLIIGFVILLLLMIVGLFTVFRKSFGAIAERKKRTSRPVES